MNICFFLFSFFLSTLSFSSQISYGGMSFECNRGCGNCEDRYVIWIEKIMQEVLSEVFRTRSPILLAGCDYYCDSTRPWQFNPEGTCIAYDWQATGGLFSSDWPTKVYSLQNHSAFLELAAALRKDCRFYWYDMYAEQLCLYKSMLLRLREERKKKQYWSLDVNPNGKLDLYEGFSGEYSLVELIKILKNDIQTLEDSLVEYYPREYERNQELIEEAIDKIDACYRTIFLWCLENHQSEGIAFGGALENFIEGDYESAIEKIRWLIHVAEERQLEDELLSKLYLLKGQVQSEFGLYADAIVELTSAIQKNPSMKEGYFERAAAYFELGQFDKALEDYLTSGFHSTIESFTQLGLGITAGIARGASESAVEFIPSLIGTLRGLGSGLWALTKNPIGASAEFVNAAIQLVEYLRSHSTTAMIQEMVPELKELIQNYDYLEDLQKGKLIGHAIGKYGMDIFLAKQGTALIKAYRDLKKANQIMTLEALACPEKSRVILTEADLRWKRIHLEALRNGEVKINPRKQGAHIVGHPEYEKRIKKSDNPSILEHADPNRLIREYAGTGVKSHRTQIGSLPGTAGYVEIVDFKEFIGYAVTLDKKEKIPTCMGKIHYAKDGAHIVPYVKMSN